MRRKSERRETEKVVGCFCVRTVTSSAPALSKAYRKRDRSCCPGLVEITNANKNSSILYYCNTAQSLFTKPIHSVQDTTWNYLTHTRRGKAVRCQLGCSIPYHNAWIRILAPLLIPASANGYPGKQQVLAQEVEFLQPRSAGEGRQRGRGGVVGSEFSSGLLASAWQRSLMGNELINGWEFSVFV